MHAVGSELEGDGSALSRRALGALTMAVGLALGCSSPQYAAPTAEPDAEAELDVCDGGCASGRQLPEPDDSGAEPGPTEAGVSELGAGSDGAELGSGDAGDAMSPAADSDAAPEDAQDWKQQMLGTYALRLRSYGREQTLGSLASFATQQLFIAEVTLDAEGEVTMTTTLCEDESNLVTVLSATRLRVLKPEVFPRRTYQVQFEDGEFHTVGLPIIVGYNATAPDECVPGQKIMRREEQVWMTSGRCDCPVSDAPPTLLTDCRLTDPDMDEKPGYTIEATGFIRGMDYCRLQEGGQFEDGTIAEDGKLTATYARNNDFYQIDCASGDCTRANGSSCPGVRNTAEFALVELAPGAELTCPDLLTQIRAGGLLSPEQPAIPPECRN